MSHSPNPQLLSVWQERFTRFASTDLTVAEFCRSEGVSTPSFYRWRKIASPPSSPSPRFVPLTLSTVQVATLRLPGGASIDLPGDLSRSRLSDLFSAVIEATHSEASPC
jgi:hypothetical protein